MDFVKAFLDALLPLLATLLVAVLTPLALRAGRALTAKADAETQRQTDARVTGWVYQAVHYAEEWARAQLRAGVTVTGAAKLQQAMAYVVAQIQAAGLPEIAAAQLRLLIEAALHMERPELDATAAPGTAAATVPAGTAPTSPLAQ